MYLKNMFRIVQKFFQSHFMDVKVVLGVSYSSYKQNMPQKLIFDVEKFIWKFFKIVQKLFPGNFRDVKEVLWQIL